MIVIGMHRLGHTLIACVPLSSGQGYIVAGERDAESWERTCTTWQVDESGTIYTEPHRYLADKTHAIEDALERAGYKIGGLVR